MRPYTVVGYWEPRKDPWLEFGVGETPEEGVRDALRGAMEANDWDVRFMELLKIVEVVEGHHPGLLGNKELLVASELVGDPKHWKPSRERARPEPFIEISEGRLICRHCGPKDERLEFPANKSGAKALGDELQARGFRSWLYSSSVDFPREYGARNIDFRGLIETAAGLEPLPPEERPI